jgi:hypothetical protein
LSRRPIFFSVVLRIFWASPVEIENLLEMINFREID